MSRRLGRKGPRPAHYSAGADFIALDPTRHMLTLPPLPSAVDLTAPWPSIYLGYNDEVGDCGVAGLANGLSTEARREKRITAFAGRTDINDAIRSLYFEYTKGVDEGVVLLDFLRWVQARPDGFLGEKIGEPIAVNPKSWDQIALALGYGFGLYIGAEMTEASVSQEGGTFWRTDIGDQSIVGGHCMFASGCLREGSFGQPNFSVESWAMKFYATLDWWKHVDEAYILVDLARPSNCFNLETLRADVAGMSGKSAIG